MKQIYLSITAVVLAVICIILAIDRVRLNSAFSAVGSRMSEKTVCYEQDRADFKRRLDEKNKQIRDLAGRFQFVTEVRAPVLDPELLRSGDDEKDAEEMAEKKSKEVKKTVQKLPPFAQVLNDPEIEKTAKQIMKDAGTPLPENVKNAFLHWKSAQKTSPAQKLFIDPVSGRVIDRDAAILETACRMMNLNASTEIRWDMTDIVRSCKTVISAPPATQEDPSAPSTPVILSVPPVQVEYGQTSSHISSAVSIQNAPLSTIFVFPTVVLPAQGERSLLLRLQELPVGGLYIHRFDVVRGSNSGNEFWMLEYKLPAKEKGSAGKGKDERPAPYSLRAFSLLPGKSIASSVSGDRLVFRVPFINGKSSLIVFGDRAFFPESVTAYPYAPVPMLFSGK